MAAVVEVKVLCLDSSSIDVSVPHNASVAQLKAQAFPDPGDRRVRLVFGGRELGDGETVGHVVGTAAQPVTMHAVLTRGSGAASTPGQAGSTQAGHREYRPREGVNPAFTNALNAIWGVFLLILWKLLMTHSFLFTRGTVAVLVLLSAAFAVRLRHSYTQPVPA